MINIALSSWIPCFGLSDLASSLGQLHILDLFFIGLLITSQMQAILLWSCSSLDKYFPNGCELLLVCNIFHFRIFRFYVIILTIYHFILILFIFNIHTVKISTDQKKKASMVTVFLAMMARMTIIVVFALIYLNTSDLYLCISSWVFLSLLLLK